MKKIFNTPEVNVIEMEAAQVIAASTESGLKSTDAGIGNGGNTSGEGIGSLDARQGGGISATSLDF